MTTILILWGDGDSLDRERVRDILVIKYDVMTKHFTAVQFYGRILKMRTREKGISILSNDCY